MSIGTISVHKPRQWVMKKIISAALFMAVGFLLARVALISSLSPFGPAFIAACFLARRQETLLAAAGVCLGALLNPENTLYIVTISILICTALLFIKNVLKRWTVLLTTACAYAVAAAVFKTNDVYTFMTAVLDCLIALVMVYVLYTLVDIFTSKKKRSVYTTEETISLALGTLIIVCMFGPLNILGVYIANIVAMFLVICVAYAGGAALGAGVGLALGTACCLGIAAEVIVIGMFGISGMVAGTIRRLKKPGTALGFILANLLFIIAFFNTAVWYLVVIEVAASTLLFIFVPKKVFLFAGKYFDMKTRREYEYRLHSKRFKELTVDRLNEVSEVFYQTGEMFAKDAMQTIRNDVNISGVLSIVAESTCKDCVFKKSCWDKDFVNTYNVFNKLFTSYEAKGSVGPRDIDPRFAKKCYNVAGILSTAESVFSAYLLNVQWKKKIEESRLITGKQLKGVAKVVSDIGREMDTGFRFLETVEHRVAASLDAAGIHAREVCAESSVNGGMVVGLKVKNCGGQGDCRYVMERAVSKACGAKMKAAKGVACTSNKICTLRFEQARRYGVLTGIAMRAKGKISGDSHSFQGLKDGRYMLMLCDGMGSGEIANQESTAAVSLMENFYQAGFDDAIIFDTINRLLLLKGNEDMFSTVDLCMLDLHTGEAKFTKIGAERSYILGQNDLITINPGSLPIGILEEVKPISTRKVLHPDDMIVMMSDGVSDLIKEEPVMWFADIPMSNAQETADAILQKALGDNPPSDDMTVMVSQMNEESPP